MESVFTISFWDTYRIYVLVHTIRTYIYPYRKSTSSVAPFPFPYSFLFSSFLPNGEPCIYINQITSNQIKSTKRHVHVHVHVHIHVRPLST